MQWRIIGENALRFRSWNKEFVIYSTLSGDTHILDEAAVQILQTLQVASLDTLSLAQTLADKWKYELSDDFLHKVETLLSDMHALSLVERG